MYAALWRSLPGPWPVKAVQVLVLGGGVVALLFLAVFPWLEPRLPFNDSTVDEVSSSTTAPTSTSAPTGAPAPDSGTTAAPPTQGSGPAPTGEGGLSAPSVVASPSASLPG